MCANVDDEEGEEWEMACRQNDTGNCFYRWRERRVKHMMGKDNTVFKRQAPFGRRRLQSVYICSPSAVRVQDKCLSKEARRVDGKKRREQRQNRAVIGAEARVTFWIGR